MYSLWEANERRKPIITCGYDLMPEFAGEKLELTEEDIINWFKKICGVVKKQYLFQGLI